MISIIIPVYNAQSTLRRCLDSILSQDYTDYEVLVVDDGSTDDSPAICDEYAAKDSRFRVFHKSNGGVSSARNVGLDNTKGEWITFADSDDMFEDGAFSTIAGRFQEQPQLILENVYVVDRGKKFIVFHVPITKTSTLFTSVFHGSVCNKVFKKIIIENYGLRFDETLSFCEDCLFVAGYCAHIDSITYLSEGCYTQYVQDTYSKKYQAQRKFEQILKFYNKAKKINPTYASTLVDGVTMSLLKDLSDCKIIESHKKILAFKENIGADIINAKGKKKFAIRWLSKLRRTCVWDVILTIYSKLHLA